MTRITQQNGLARSLDGVAASVCVVELPDVPSKSDVSDWLDAGGTDERLAELVEATSEWTPADDGPAAATRLSDIAAEPIRWLWHSRFPLGKLALVVGDPGTGKSTLAIDLAARVSAGLPWPDSPDVPMSALGGRVERANRHRRLQHHRCVFRSQAHGANRSDCQLAV